jgi:hypothetical protein
LAGFVVNLLKDYLPEIPIEVIEEHNAHSEMLEE